MASQLQQHIDEIPNLSLSNAIHAIVELTADLTPSVSPKGQYIVHHSCYDGPGNLEDLGKHFLNAGDRCQNEHAPFELRLLHQSLDDVFTKIYGEAIDLYREGLANGTIVPEPSDFQGCGCCEGVPSAVIGCGFHEQKAFFFEEAEYRQIWGSERECGSSTGWDADGGKETWLMASKGQIERAMNGKL